MNSITTMQEKIDCLAEKRTVEDMRPIKKVVDSISGHTGNWGKLRAELETQGREGERLCEATSIYEPVNAVCKAMLRVERNRIYEEHRKAIANELLGMYERLEELEHAQ